MAISHEEARRQRTEKTGHDRFSETTYGVICSACHNYILIDQDHLKLAYYGAGHMMYIDGAPHDKLKRDMAQFIQENGGR